MYTRTMYQTLWARLQEPRRFIQILAGPRQVGKTTLVRQVMNDLTMPVHFASADGPGVQDTTWIQQQWDLGRLRARDSTARAVLALDEIQKGPYWSDLIKKLWDEDTSTALPLPVVLLGSSPLLMQNGLVESLTGRFERIPLTHWSYDEMAAAFGWSLEQYLCFGGYPGAAPLIEDEPRSRQYILDALIETTISRDILLLTRVDKPALLRQLFQLGCAYSGQILSYTKMIGQLQDAGNTTTLAHYLNLLSGAGMVTGIPKFAGGKISQRSSSPKFQVLNTALMTAQSNDAFETIQDERNRWGRIVESAVGAHLVNATMNSSIEAFYWRERNAEVDFILQDGAMITALEVKSGSRKTRLPGMADCVKNISIAGNISSEPRAFRWMSFFRHRWKRG